MICSLILGGTLCRRDEYILFCQNSFHFEKMACNRRNIILTKVISIYKCSPYSVVQHLRKKTILPAHKVFGLTNHVRLSVLWSYIATRVFVVSENVYENR